MYHVLPLHIMFEDPWIMSVSIFSLLKTPNMVFIFLFTWVVVIVFGFLTIYLHVMSGKGPGSHCSVSLQLDSHAYILCQQ